MSSPTSNPLAPRPSSSSLTRTHGSRPRRSAVALLSSLWIACCLVLIALAATTATATPESTTDAHNNWAVLIDSSRFWFNYRHIANTLSLYRTVKRLGIPDDNILLMLADDIACNPRNSLPAKVINNADARLDLYGQGVEVDYRGYEVTAEAVIRLLTDRLSAHFPRSKRLLTDHESRILVFMTGHGGDEFLKFQDAEELGAQDLADAFEQMREARRFKELLFMIDTCQANTMYGPFRSPGIVAAGSSAKGENSYSHHMDMDLGVAVIDRFTYWTLDHLEKLDRRTAGNASLADMFKSFTWDKMHSTVGVREDLFERGFADAKIGEFFAGSRPVKVTPIKADEQVVAVDADKFQDGLGHEHIKEAEVRPSPAADVRRDGESTNEHADVGDLDTSVAYIPVVAMTLFLGLMCAITIL
ncbi:peptidase C13 family-domain-containing protein [Catenaria anguillulae PL171]|uniref:Peptidase C13 family-domain-containing protein n=1 Tax=Catenaria anguillulae PL171 TaxID=765915 RepID=A0A1Y2HMQ1_9FUNG|nr:peptidase C13 family-domain-containing protein [Catenaria anguillulae PL171]